MRNQITSVAAALCLLSAPQVTDARKQLVGADEQRIKTKASPLVGDGTCEEICVVGTDSEQKTYWCFLFDEPVITFGNEFNQDANTDATSTPNKHLRFDALLYLQFHLKVTSTLDIYRLYFNQFILEIPQIDVEIESGMIINELGQICPHLSWNRSAIGIDTTYRQEFPNCSKVLVKNFWDIEGVYTGKYAKIIDECSMSQAGTATSDDPQVTATFWQIDWFDAITDQILFGTVDPESATGCRNLPLVSSAAVRGQNGNMVTLSAEEQMAQLAFKTIFDYVYSWQSKKEKFGHTYSYSL